MAVLQQAELESALVRALALAQALAVLHASQQLHGGLCPQAVHFLPDGSVGLAAPPAPGLALSLQGLRYASPEQAGRVAVVDARSDLYSLGLLLYEWLLGRPAYDSQDPLALAYHQISVLPPAPHTLNAGVPPQVSDLVLLLLAKAPQARYASAQGLADDLQRCLQALADGGPVARFALGQTDLRSQFHLPEQLYGRARDMAALLQLWRRAARGEQRLCLLSGAAGLGKTALVRALRASVRACGGVLLEGCCDAQQHELPGQALVQAFKPLLQRILAVPAPERARWRTRLLAGLGPHLAVLQEVLPELEWITGRQPAAPLLVGLAAQQRRNAAYTDLLTLLAVQGHPLLLFLDDLHAADAAALSFIRALLRGPRRGHVLLVGAYRPCALEAGAPLTRLLGELQQGHTRLSEIRLEPLSPDEVAALIDDSCFHISELPALTQLVMEHTRGRPQDIRHYLQALVSQGRLRYVPAAGGWRWTAVAPASGPSLLWWT